ncbi:polysaccharide deacetylase [Knoellia remsis]|uniref:Polysaccharide deacetylase n=1 Tax=Knoellia remsis TaxID=407159 RepID=A0A2T0V0G4_9MICO|nr:polysaccharide deacetylase family protein [Knoellia remsis]PRY63675.1 polysaccharide deacetylase [Knoellia remsis]
MRGRTPLVLMYHGLGVVPRELDPAHLFVPVAAFAAQLDRLACKGFELIDESAYLDVLDGRAAHPRGVLVTFDDGYCSILEHAAPVLAQRDAPAICFVSPGLAGQSAAPAAAPAYQLMDDDEMRALAQTRVALGCHSWTHDSMVDMSDACLDEATTQARERMRQVLGRTPRTYAYPYGDHDARARQAVREAGFECAFATYTGGGRFAIPRIDVNAGDTPRTFDLKLQRAYPLARRALGHVPRVRSFVHDLVGHAERV